MVEQTQPLSEPTRPQPLRNIIGNILRERTALLALLVLAVSVALSILTPAFLSSRNLTFVVTGMTYDLLMALGMTVVLLLWGIDLSVGSVLGLTAVVTTLLLQDGVSIPLAIAIGLSVSALCGATNGFFVAYLKIAPFIVTLGMMSVARGIATVLTSGYFVSGLPEEYRAIGQGTLFDVPYMVYFALIVVIILHYLLRNWRPLKEAFYIGTNPEAARLSGMRVAMITLAGYVFCSMMAGTAAIFMTSRLSMGFFQFGLGAELEAIAAAVIGGASLRGGSGSVLGTTLAVLLLALINNGFVLLQGSPNWQNVITGAILIVAIVTDAYRRRKESRE
ncbi:MAG: ABC transporter permease [Chloroflexi bacterium]|nr:ABC transporter permease [Chloroflexota bacterium]